MILPDGWRFMPAQYAAKVLEPGCVALDLEDCFRFDCVGGNPECCGHADTCGHTVPHQVGKIKWVHDAGVWQCPYLSAQGLCLIHKVRPISCRLFPVGISIFHEVQAIAIWRQVGVEQTCPRCHASDREWTVEQWLEDNDLAAHLPRALGWRGLI